ncbi:glycoside hydrolase [Hysterangium stoloniferum]|nr:glycoside hydrolase [Hysterangium stoloniferum]
MPSYLIFLLATCLLASTPLCEASQKCRLRQRGLTAQLPLPTSPAPDPITSAPNNSLNSTLWRPFDFSTTKVRGVNLGGWFVLEPWITPSIFQATNNTAVVDEITLGQLTDYNTTQKMLQNHWATWYTEDDFVAIRNAGLNWVRIPLGYWSVPSNESVAPYHAGAYPFFKQAVRWARQQGIHVIVDLHGAPGSQNGYDNSGQSTPNPVWGINPQNVSRTLDIIGYLATDLGNQIDAIELLNEPAGFRGTQWLDTIKQFWQSGYDVVRDVVGLNVTVVIEDAFQGVQSWEGFLTEPGASNVLMDTHEYQIFDNSQLALTWDQHISAGCTLGPPLASFAQSSIWAIIGEWSIAITDCAKWLNGRGVGARWDGTYPGQTQVFGNCSGLTGNTSTFSDDYKSFLRKYWEVQVEAGESATGWIFWTWKTESADEWSYQKGLEGGWIPQDPTNRMFPNLCS